ncbi:MAG TPA: Uma2 family endonuclease [Pirellulales bacterium]|nr:Uma2 family endonuclease [Pirellulales bacterium]
MPIAATPLTYGHDPSVARFSVDSYQRMVAAGALTSDDKVELLENYVVLKLPHNPPHDSTIQRMLRPWLKSLPDGWDLRVQSAITLSDSEPEPDFAIVRGSSADDEGRHSLAADVGLVIEVADTSLPRDQHDKGRIYANAGLPIYWVVNLVDRRIEVYSRPAGLDAAAGYTACRHCKPGDTAPLVLDGSPSASIAAADLLP